MNSIVPWLSKHRLPSRDRSKRANKLVINNRGNNKQVTNNRGNNHLGNNRPVSKMDNLQGTSKPLVKHHQLSQMRCNHRPNRQLGSANRR